MHVYVCIPGGKKRERQKEGKTGWPGMFLTKCHLEGTEPWDYHKGGELQGAGGSSTKYCSGSI